MGRQNNSLNGFVLGAIFGAVLGVLFAPTAGEKTREKIKKVTVDNEDIITDTKEKTEKLVEKTLASIDQGFNKLSDMIDERKKKTKSDFVKENGSSEPEA
jgi:gas vesicle protein